jgi:4-alpha-glucanotransferase
VTPESVCAEFLEMAMTSVSELCVLPFQDLLGLGEEARMNDPATSTGNWGWRALAGMLSEATFRSLEELTASTGRG